MPYELTPRRRAILATINWAEGLPDYGELFNYVPFNPYAPHPNQVVTAGGYSSTAAGAYQFLYSTWQDTIPDVPIDDYMSPENQDQAALSRIEWRGVLDELDNGEIEAVIQKLSWEWASLPVVWSETVSGKYYPAGSGRYGQPIKSVQAVLDYYNESLAYYENTPETSASAPLGPVAYNQAVKKKLKPGRILRFLRQSQRLLRWPSF